MKKRNYTRAKRCCPRSGGNAGGGENPAGSGRILGGFQIKGGKGLLERERRKERRLEAQESFHGPKAGQERNCTKRYRGRSRPMRSSGCGMENELLRDFLYFTGRK